MKVVNETDRGTTGRPIAAIRTSARRVSAGRLLVPEWQTVTVDGADCFVLTRRRTEPDAVYGNGGRLCFDPRFAALRRLEVQREGGATDVMPKTTSTTRPSGSPTSTGAAVMKLPSSAFPPTRRKSAFATPCVW